MPNIPEKEDSKEIRLFGEKSIREEAYRQKILQLEKEIMKLESTLQNQDKKDLGYEESGIPEYSEGLLYEASLSLDEKVKKYQHILEAKARDISERLNLQAHNLIEHEKIHTHIVVAKRALITLFLFTIIALAVSGVSLFLAFNKKDITTSYSNPYERPDYIKRFLQESGFYNNQYTIIDLALYSHTYKATIELHARPHTNWTIKMIASDIIENFKRISQDKSIQLNFIYEGNAYAKADFSSASGETHYEFK